MYLKGSPEHHLFHFLKDGGPLIIKALSDSYIFTDGKRDFELRKYQEQDSVLHRDYQSSREDFSQLVSYIIEHKHVGLVKIEEIFR